MDCFFNHPLNWIPDWMRAQNQWQSETDFQKPPIVAKDHNDIPAWLKLRHQWEPAFDVNKLTKHQLKVNMCCSKCAEKMEEEIREVFGVFDVRVERMENKVIVVAMPGGIDERQVLLKARKIHKKAKFVELDQKERPKKDDNKNNKQDGNKNNKQDGDRKEVQAKSSQSKSGVVQVNWSDHLYWPISSNAPRYRYAPNQIERHPNPHGQFVQFL